MTGSQDRGPARRRPGRPPKGDAGDTRDALQRAALRLFARKGFAGTSIRAIAGEVGLSESVLYAHFANKQAIFDAVLAQHGPQRPDDAASGMDAALAESDPPAYLRALVDAFLDDWDRQDARLLISLMVRDGLVHGPTLQQALEAMRQAVAAMFGRWIDAGHMRGELGPPGDLALTFTGPIGLARILHLHADADAEERAAARRQVRRHVEVFVRASFATGADPR